MARADTVEKKSGFHVLTFLTYIAGFFQQMEVFFFLGGLPDDRRVGRHLQGTRKMCQLQVVCCVEDDLRMATDLRKKIRRGAGRGGGLHVHLRGRGKVAGCAGRRRASVGGRGEKRTGPGKGGGWGCRQEKGGFSQKSFQFGHFVIRIKGRGTPCDQFTGERTGREREVEREVAVYPKVFMPTKRQVLRPLYVINLFIKSII